MRRIFPRCSRTCLASGCGSTPPRRRWRTSTIFSNIAYFEPLPYFVNPALRPVPWEDSERQPLRLVCAGLVREEKGVQHLAQVVQELWPDYLAPGRLQLLRAGPAQAV